MGEPDDLHRDFRAGELRESDVDRDPIVQFQRWLSDAVAAGEREPYATTLATATKSGAPSARVVYLRGLDASGFVFFTNFESRKGREIAENARAALCFHWTTLHRQVRVEGVVERASDAESDAYFRGRPRGSQLGAWASPQSRVLASRDELERCVAQVEAKFPGDVPRPPFWGGLRLAPSSIEFWQGRESRLHDRLRFTRAAGVASGASGEAVVWKVERLAP